MGQRVVMGCSGMGLGSVTAEHRGDHHYETEQPTLGYAGCH
jgi:hypothetical protein